MDVMRFIYISRVPLIENNMLTIALGGRFHHLPGVLPPGHGRQLQHQGQEGSDGHRRTHLGPGGGR